MDLLVHKIQMEVASYVSDCSYRRFLLQKEFLVQRIWRLVRTLAKQRVPRGVKSVPLSLSVAKMGLLKKRIEMELKLKKKFFQLLSSEKNCQRMY